MQSANKSLRVPLSTKHERLGVQRGKRERWPTQREKPSENDVTRTERVGRTDRGAGVDHVVWFSTDSLSVSPFLSLCLYACVRTFLSIIKNCGVLLQPGTLVMVKLLSSLSLVYPL